MKTQANDFAFPTPPGQNDEYFSGLTKREEFAKAAMQGLLACPNVSCDPSLICKYSVEWADELIAELNK